MEAQSTTLVGSLRRSEGEAPELDEAELDRLIQRRASEPTARETANAVEESWKALTRAYNAERREARRYEWIAHFERWGRAHCRLSER